MIYEIKNYLKFYMWTTDLYCKTLRFSKLFVFNLLHLTTIVLSYLLPWNKSRLRDHDQTPDTCDTWQVTFDMWHVVGGENLKCQLPRSYGFDGRVFFKVI